MGFLDKAKQAAQNAQKEGGILDKAKDAAKQAQDKLDEKQKEFNQRQQAGSAAPAGDAAPVEYDEHGRPVDAPGTPPAPPAAPSTAPAVPEAAVEAAAEPAPQPADSAPPAAAQPPAADAPTTQAPAPPAPSPSGGPDAPQEGSDGEYAPPKMSSGDPLAG
jgi:hypothetical protein